MLILVAQQLLVPLLVRALFLQAITVYFGCLSSVVKFRKNLQEEFQDILEFLQKEHKINYA